MAVACAICGKTRQVGNRVSHANNKTKRLFRPNLKQVRAKVGDTTCRIRVCTTCIRSNRIVKPG